MTVFMMRPAHLASLGLCLLLAGCGSKRDRKNAPEQVENWRGAGIALAAWGPAGSAIFAASVKPFVLEVWQWNDGRIEKRYAAPLPDDICSVAILPNDRWIGKVLAQHERRAKFCIGNLRSGAEIDRWPEPLYMNTDLGTASRNGEHVPAWSSYEVGSPRYPNTGSEARIGLVASGGESIDWLVLLTSKLRTPPHVAIHRVLASNDGASIGVAGWDKGLAMIDAAKKKVLWVASPENRPESTKSPTEAAKSPTGKVAWKTLPLDEINAFDLAFSPDGKLVYVTGDKGCVSALKVATGEVLSQWWATPSGKWEADRGITTVSASPDGRFVAAGTGPEGLVFLFSTKDGRHRVLNHGGPQIMITNFSPDSKHLVSYAGGKLKVWKVSEPAKEPQGEKTEE